MRCDENGHNLGFAEINQILDVKNMTEDQPAYHEDQAAFMLVSAYIYIVNIN